MTDPNAVRTRAVENFLSSLGGVTKAQALGNLALDARSYRWNAPTVKAIKDGIDKKFTQK